MEDEIWQKLWELREEMYKADKDSCNRLTALESADTTEDKVHSDYSEERQYGISTLIAVIGLTATFTSVIITILYYTKIIGH
jgi:hypothetical protein